MRDEKEKNDGAELIHQAIPDVDGTEPRPNYGPETDTWEDRGFAGPVCRCGHERDQHGSRYEQRRGEKVYVQKCEQCLCETFVDKDGQLSRMIDTFLPMRGVTK